jgi:peptide deformylase
LYLSEDLQEGEEGCLSFPELRYDTPRSMRVVARGWNMYGEPISIEGSELLARALQHETDHLDGILFIDHLSKENRKSAMKEIRESDWFGLAKDSGLNPEIRVSPHYTFGKGL